MSESEKDAVKKEDIKQLSPSKKIDVGGGIQIHGNTISGDKISVGNISGSSGVAIGRNAYAVVRSDTDLIEYMQMLIELEPLSGEEKDNLIAGVAQIQEIISSPNTSNDGLLNFIFRSIKYISPSVFEILAKRVLIQENISPDTKRLIKGIL